jgi:hypothetical protein
LFTPCKCKTGYRIPVDYADDGLDDTEDVDAKFKCMARWGNMEECPFSEVIGKVGISRCGSCPHLADVTLKVSK